MRAEIEEPVTVDDGRGGTITRHPAYGQISAARRQGGHMTLYGSDFVHNSTVAISIHASELHRGLSRDWNFAKNEIIEVVLSESQWATFVSSLNMGSGPCCTIQHVNAERKPWLPVPQDRSQQYGSEFVETLNDAVKRVDDAIAKVSASGLSGKKSADIINELKMAKQEIHGYINGHIARAGLEAIQSSRDVLFLETSDVSPTPSIQAAE